MTLAIKGLNMDLTDGIKARVEEKMDLLSKLVAEFEPAASARVEVGKTSNHHNKGPVFRAEVNLVLPGTELRAEDEREDLYEAIDVVVADLKRQLVGFRERLQGRRDGVRPGKE